MQLFSRPSVNVRLDRISRRLTLFTTAVICLLLAPAAAFASNSIVIINAPNSNFYSGGNAGVIMVAEETSGGALVNASGGLSLTISSGTTSAGPYTTGTTTGLVTPTYVNGMATFDLSTVPLYAFSGGGTQTYTLTYADVNTPSISATSTVTVLVPTHLYIVTNFSDPGTSPACNDKNTSGFTLDSNCTLRQALTNVAALTSSQSATIAFSGTWPQTINLASNLQGVNWVSGLTIAGPGVNNLLISGATSALPTTPAFTILREKSSVSTTLLFSITGLTLEYALSTAANGAALYIYGPATVSNMSFLNNTDSDASGGAMYVNSADAGMITISNSIFQGNSNTTNNAVTSLTINTGGSGCTASPTVTFTPTNGGSGASATAVESGGSITTLTLTNGGSGYVTAPTISFNDSCTGTATAAISANAAGGALSDGTNTGNLSINNSSFINNTATGNGGAVSFTGTVTTANTLTITNSLFSGNSSSGGNAGALNLALNSSSTHSTTTTLTNDTIYNNSAANQFGGAVYLGESSADHQLVTATNLTVIGNKDTDASSPNGGGIYCSSTCTLTLTNSIVSGNELTASATGAADLGYSVTPTITTSIYSTTNTSNNAYPGIVGLKLSDLGSYGGPTQTFVPLPGSPAIQFGNGAAAATTDQRGFFRPSTGSANVDVGAVQTAGSLTFSTPPTNVNTGATYSPSPAVSYTDSGYSLSSTAAPVPIALTQSAGTLSGAVSANMTGGLVTFGGLSSTTPETGVTLTATAGTGSTKAQVISNGFNITANASNLVFTSLPSPTISAGNSSGSFNVSVEDGYGNVITGSSATINVAITASGYGGSNTNQNASSGVATFSGTPLTIPGSYTYTATSSGLTQATEPETVSINTTALTLGATSTSLAYGTQDNLTATLSPSSQGSASTNGETVTFLNNGNSIGTATLSSGTATLNTANLPTGPNSLTASYPGDTSFSSSTASPVVETSTPAPSSAVSSGTATATFTFTQNFTLGSITIVNNGTAGTPFTNSGGGTCAVSSSYGPGGTASCTVGLSYSASGGGLQTATVEIFDSNGVLQGVYNIVTPRYR